MTTTESNRRRGRPSGPSLGNPVIATLAAAVPPADDLDREINAALTAGRRLALDRAFPAPDGETPGAVGETGPVTAADYARDQRLTALHRLTLQGRSVAQCAEALRVSQRTVCRLRAELMERMRASGRFNDPLLMRGQTNEFFDRLREAAMEPALNPNFGLKERLDAMKTALAVEEARQRFLSASGAYRAYPVRQDPAVARMERMGPRPEMDGAQRLTGLLRFIIDGEAAAEVEGGQ